MHTSSTSAGCCVWLSLVPFGTMKLPLCMTPCSAVTWSQRVTRYFVMLIYNIQHCLSGIAFQVPFLFLCLTPSSALVDEMLSSFFVSLGTPSCLTSQRDWPLSKIHFHNTATVAMVTCHGVVFRFISGGHSFNWYSVHPAIAQCHVPPGMWFNF